MKPIRRMTQSIRGLASRAVAIFGRSGGRFLSTMLLAGSNRNWSKEAGPRYDNSAVFAVIQYLTSQLTGDPRLIVQKQQAAKSGKVEWAETIHELPTLLRSGIMSEDQILAGVILSLVVSGNGYWIKDRSLNRKPLGFLYVPHWSMSPINDRPSPFGDRVNDGTHFVTFYEYTSPEGVRIPFRVDDVVHFRWGTDPVSPMYGLSPIFAALREVVTDNEAATLGAALLSNAGIPGVAISPKAEVINDLTPKQTKDLNTKFQRRVSGDMAGTPFIAPFPCDYTVIGFSPDKLVLDKTRALAVTRIMSAFGIDPMVLGFPSEQKTYSNFEEALRHAWRSACKPLARLIAETLYHQVLLIDYAQDSEKRVYWDFSEVPEEQVDVNAEAHRLALLWEKDGITRVDLRSALGYEVDDARDNVFYSHQKPKPEPMIEPVKKNPEADKKPEKARALRALMQERLALQAVSEIPD